MDGQQVQTCLGAQVGMSIGSNVIGLRTGMQAGFYAFVLSSCLEALDDYDQRKSFTCSVRIPLRARRCKLFIDRNSLLMLGHSAS